MSTAFTGGAGSVLSLCHRVYIGYERIAPHSSRISGCQSRLTGLSLPSLAE